MDFNIQINKIEHSIIELDLMTSKLRRSGLELENVNQHLIGLEGAAIYEVRKAIQRNRQEVKRLEKTMEQYRLVLKRISATYQKSENVIATKGEQTIRRNKSNLGRVTYPASYNQDQYKFHYV